MELEDTASLYLEKKTLQSNLRASCVSADNSLCWIQHWSQKPGRNWRISDHRSDALPLSYAGTQAQPLETLPIAPPSAKENVA